VSILHSGTPFSPVKIAPSHGGSGSPSNTWFLGPTRVLNPNGISIGSAVFVQMTAECPYTLQLDAPFPLKIAGTPLSPSKWPLPMEDLDPHLIHGSLGPPEFSTKRHLDGSAVFAGRTSVTDRQTDRPRYSVSSNRPHLHT